MPDPSPTSNPDSVVRAVHCKTPKEFLDALSRRGYGFRGPLPKHWIFRGHADDAYQLIPSALRNNSQQLIEQSNYPTVTDNKTQRFLEICTLDEFFKTADSIGLALPEDTQLLRNYLKRARHEPDLWPEEQVLSLMALAQHHGVPTRLLDWSRHPLKAALFAASGAIKDADITFDDLDGSGNQTISNGYKGFNWTNFYTYDAVNDPAHLNPSGYQFAAVSPNIVAFGGGMGFGNPAFASNTLFNLGSAYLTSIWRDNLQIQVTGFLSGVPIYNSIYTLSATGHTLLNFNYHGIDSVEFSVINGGTHHTGYNAFDGTQFAIDNLTVSVPDSGTAVMLFSIGVCALGFLRKKLT